jgi:Replication stress response SDE2 C-terminal
MKYRPADCVPVYDLLTADEVTDENGSMDTKTMTESAAVEEDAPQLKEPKQKKTKPVPPKPLLVEPLDLDEYASQSQLEELGMDRLKGALMALGVKCGGSLSERAARLFSLKGLKREDFPMKVRAKNFKV